MRRSIWEGAIGFWLLPQAGRAMGRRGAMKGKPAGAENFKKGLRCGPDCHTRYGMKMTLHIDEALLERVTAIYGCESKTAAVALALGEMDRRHKLRSYADRGLGLSAAELREAVDPEYDLMANRYGSSAKVSSVTTSKPHGRRRAG